MTDRFPPAVIPLPERKPSETEEALHDSSSEDSPTGLHVWLGGHCHWQPEALTNAHAVILGASGSGKTQTLKAIAHSLHQQQPDLRVRVLDFHGDQSLPEETVIPLHQCSPWGIAPLTVHPDPEGGGPGLQAIAVAASLRRLLKLGPNQEGLLLNLFDQCYRHRGITTAEETWRFEPPTFADLERFLAMQAESGLAEAKRLQLKLAALFRYGVFSRPQSESNQPLLRLDLCKLPPEIAALAAESFVAQELSHHRLNGEADQVKTVLFIDEAKELRGSAVLDRVLMDGRKYGLAIVLASQSEQHLSAEVLRNSATKVVLPVDQTEVRTVARRFRLSEDRLAKLQPLEAICRFGVQLRHVQIHPYWQRQGAES